MTQQVLYILRNYNKNFTPDTDPAAVIDLRDSTYQVDEGSSFTFYIDRAIKTNQVVTVDWAFSGVNMNNNSGTATLTNGSSSVGVTVTAQGIPGSTEVGTLTISNPQYVSGADPGILPVLGSPTSATITVNEVVPPVVGDRRLGAGLHATWGQWNDSYHDIPYFKGAFGVATVNSVCPNGDFDPPTLGNYNNIDRHWSLIDGTAQGDKYLTIQIADRKDADWQKHVWYAENASSLYGVSRRETPDWIQAWWSNDGLDVMTGIFDLQRHYYLNDLSQAQRDRVIGIRTNFNAQSSDGS